MTCSGYTTKIRPQNTLSRPDNENLTQRKMSLYTVLYYYIVGMCLVTMLCVRWVPLTYSSREWKDSALKLVSGARGLEAGSQRKLCGGSLPAFNEIRYECCVGGVRCLRLMKSFVMRCNANTVWGGGRCLRLMKSLVWLTIHHNTWTLWGSLPAFNIAIDLLLFIFVSLYWCFKQF